MIFNVPKDILEMILSLLPKIIEIIMVLVLGFIAGKLVGKMVTIIMGKFGVDKVIGNSSLGKTLKEANLTLSSLIGTLAKWAVYLATLIVVADILQITALSNLLVIIVGYIPYLISGFLIIGFGLLFADFISKIIVNSLKEIKFIHAGVVGFFTRLFMYIIVILTALSVMKLDITLVNIFVSAMAWGLAAGMALAMGLALGLGFKDMIAKNAESFLKSIGLMTSRLDQEVRIKELEGEIKRLESELDVLRQEKRKEIEEKRVRLEALSKPVENVEDFLNKVVGSTGKIAKVYGGYEITISDPITFPWRDVIMTMYNMGYDVWISKKDDAYCIVCKLKTEQS
jgi:hypothetical protein